MPGGLKRAMQTFSAANQSSVKGYGKKRVLPVNEVESLLVFAEFVFCAA